MAPRWQILWRQHGPFGGTLARIFGPQIWRGRRTLFRSFLRGVVIPTASKVYFWWQVSFDRHCLLCPAINTASQRFYHNNNGHMYKILTAPLTTAHNLHLKRWWQVSGSRLRQTPYIDGLYHLVCLNNTNTPNALSCLCAYSVFLLSIWWAPIAVW